MFLDEYPGVRFSRRLRLWEIIMRTFASLLAGRVAKAARSLFLSRPQAAEFSSSNVTKRDQATRDLSGLRAAERASNGALRRNYNSVNIEDHYGISFIRERFAAPTRRRLPQKGRRSPVPAETQQHPEGAGAEIALGEVSGFFHQRQSTHREGPGTCAREWLAFRRLTAAFAQA